MPIPAVVTRIVGPMPPVSEFAPVRFSLRKTGKPRKTVIYLHKGPHSWSLSAAINQYPKTFTEARILVRQVAASHGYEPFQEIIKPRMPRAHGEDRRILREGGCREAWLRSDIPELWAEAVVRCEHAGAFCGQDGYCHLGGCRMEMTEPK